MFKNVATKVALFAFDTTTGAPKTGDAANITAYVSKDFGAVAVLADTSATEMDATNAKGWYLFDVAQAEANADVCLFTAKSSTANISIVGVRVDTTPNLFSSLSIDASGRIDIGKLLGTAWLTPGTAGTPDVNAKFWNALATVALPLVPATAGRTLVVDAAGLADANMVKVGPTGAGAAQTAGDLAAGQTTIQSRLPAALVGGRMDSSIGAILGTALTETAGQIAAAFKKFFNIAAPVSTMDALNLVATATAVTNRVNITTNAQKGVALMLSFVVIDASGNPQTGKAGVLAAGIAADGAAADTLVTLPAFTEIAATGEYWMTIGAVQMAFNQGRLRITCPTLPDILFNITTQP